jgi:hypothetical protein
MLTRQDENDRLSKFKEKYEIKQKITSYAKAFSPTAFMKMEYLPKCFDHGSVWRNQDGFIVVEMELYDFENKKEEELKRWCKEWKFTYIKENELLPFNCKDGQVIILISNLRSRSVKNLIKNGVVDKHLL